MNRDSSPHGPHNEGMGSEYRAGRYLGADFDLAAREGDASVLREVFEATRVHELLERYSARMAAREFMVEQKGLLATLDEEVARLEEVEPMVRNYLDDMLQSYDSTMIRPYDKQDAEQQGQLERAVALLSDEKVVEVARHIAGVDARLLIKVADVQEWMEQDVKNMIIESLWAVVQDEREGATASGVRTKLHEEIARIVHVLDAKIPGSMLK